MQTTPEVEGLYLATHYGLFLLRDGELFQVGEIRDDLMGFSAHPDNPATFYASGHPRGGGNLGVIVSEDGGLNWQQIFTGVGEEVVDFHSMVASPADPERLYGVAACEAVGVLLDDTQDGPALLAPTGPRGGGSLGRCALPRSAGLAALRLLVSGNGGELAFDRFEFSIDIGLLLKRLVTSSLKPRALLHDKASECFRFRHW